MDLTAKERQGRGLDALAAALRPYVEVRMSAAIEGHNWVALYEAKETHRRGRPFKLQLDDPRQLMQMIRYERLAFGDIDASQRAWLEELIQAANRAAHTTEISQRQADRALDTMMWLADSLSLDVPTLLELRLANESVQQPEEPAPAPRRAVADDSVPTDAESAPPSQVVESFPVDTPRGARSITARVQGARIVVLYQEAVNLALTHNNVSPVRSIEITNEVDHDLQLDTLEIAIETPAAAGDLALGVPLKLTNIAVGPGQTYVAQGPELAMRLSPAVFLALDEAVSTTIRLEVTADEATYVGEGPIRLLTAEEWWAAAVPESLAAFVRPNDPSISDLLKDASRILSERTGSSSLEGYQAGPGRVEEIAAAIYEAIAARKIAYVEPPASFEGTGQRIRTHAQVLEDGLGTCLDLACTYTAALEQAGIHPILAVFDGHAFAGYLTEDDQLPSVVIQDEPTVITIVDSDFFDAVETTAVCQAGVSFAQAKEQTTHWWSADLSKIRFLLDVHAAHHRVKPLPTIRVEGNTRVIEVVRDAAWQPSGRTPARTAPRTRVEPVADDTPARIQRWERALLDMSYANPLLRRKNSSSIGIHIPNGALGLFEDKIADGRSLRLVAHDEIEQIHREQGARTAADIEPEAIRTILEREGRLFVALPEREYQRRLKSLARRSKTAVEETGSDNLYLTLGTLEWTDGGRKGSAPLFLVPIRLTGGRGVVPFSIEIDDSRERVPNYCLIEKLKVSYGLNIPELEIPEEDESGIDVAGALGAIRTAILRARNTVGFHVEETAYLALLQFSTLEMWQDLRTNWRQFMKRPAVRHLVENAGGIFQDGITVPDPQPQDEARTFLPIPADGSQIDAVRWAAAGKTFILEGPPGTGKSQTITNLIANSMAMGKKVLFVAEKSAALEVVRRRLESVGLGVFSLDVHGRTQTVAAVRDQLRVALEEHATSETGWEPLQSSYAMVTESLARYPAQLHQAGPVGLSAWDARQLILEQSELGADEATAIQVPQSVVLGDVDLPEFYAMARELSSHLYDLGGRPADSPWTLTGALDPDNLDRQRIAAAINRLELADGALGSGDAAQLSTWLLDHERFSALAEWFDTAEAGTAWPTGLAASVVDVRWTDEALRRRDAIANFRAGQDQRLGSFTPAALQLDLPGLLERSQEIDHRLFGKRKRREALIAELGPTLRAALDPGELTGALQNLISIRDASEQLRDYVGQLPMINLRPGWSAFDDRDVKWFDSTVNSLKVAARLRQSFAGLPEGAAPSLEGLDTATEAILQERRPADGAGAALREYSDAWVGLCTALNANPSTIAGWLNGRDRATAVRSELPRWRADAQSMAFIGLQRWARLRGNLDRFSQLGLDDLVRRAMSGQHDPLDFEPQLRIGVAKAVLNERLSGTGLVGFDEADHQRRIDLFARRGAEVRARMPNELRARVIGSRSFDPNARRGEVEQLRRELGRRRGGRPVRRLLHDFGPLIGEITPCLLMSPHSVARFLPADADFDIVVFDEASQIRVPESIGAIGRGKAAVIVGDSKQMPPTSMFAATGEDPDEDQDSESVLVPADLESILSEAVESQLPRKLLSWHYRSRDESLIAFSNLRYYEGRLSSFPVPPSPGGRTAIELRRVNGIWEGGARAARVNRAEAQEIVEEIRSRSSVGGSSIGVVTFNSQQRDLILDLLESDEDPRIIEQLQRETEPLFVKNLENVQGDERDVILFSLAFAEDENGRVPLNWGPLTRTGGERRLNVAITRAKERVVMIASFDPRRLDLSNSNSQGLCDLKDYLLQAASGAATAVASQRDTTDKHLEDVAAALGSAGLEVRQNVGLSDFVVDLAVRRPGSDAWVAVLLDGPGWAGRTSVGDRETLPQSVLTNMGWPTVERVWLPTWLRDRESVVASIAAAVDRAQAEPADASEEDESVARSSESWGLADRPSADGQSDSVPLAAPVRGIATAGGVDFSPALVGRTEIPDTAGARPIFRPAEERALYESDVLNRDSPRSRAAVDREIDRIIDAEAPILQERLIHVLAARFSLSRVREGRRAQLLGHLRTHASRRAPNGDIVFWSKQVSVESFDGFRVPEAGGKRDIATIPYEELRNAMVEIARAGHGIDEESLLRETARLFGVTRLASQVRPRLEGVLNAAVQEGALQFDGIVVRASKVS